MSQQNKANFSENDIRPDHLKVDQHALMLADIAYLQQWKDEFVEVDCPACGSASRHAIFKKYDMQYHSCENCETLYISPRPQPHHLADFYANSQNYAYWNTHIFPASAEVRREKIFRPRAERVKEICNKLGMKPQKMVEVGAGFGLFCDEVQKMGFVEEVVAVEPGKHLAETCRKRGLKVIESTIENADFEAESVDVVCSFEVIEHLFSVGSVLEQCHHILKPGGLAIVTNPNGKGFDVVVAPHLSVTVDVEHLNYFNPQSMKVMFERYGFEILEVLTPGKLDADMVRKMFAAGQLKREDNPFLYQLLIERWDDVKDSFQEFLAENGLSSHMWTIARKK